MQIIKRNNLIHVLRNEYSTLCGEEILPDDKIEILAGNQSNDMEFCVSCEAQIIYEMFDEDRRD